MSPPQKENNDLNELFAKKVVAILGKDPEVSHEISARLAFARQNALKHMRQSKKEQNIFDKVISFFKEKTFTQYATGITAMATVCFVVIGYVAMDNENEAVYNDNVEVIATHFEKADSILSDVENTLTDNDEDNNETI